jgi:CysZ protein
MAQANSRSRTVHAVFEAFRKAARDLCRPRVLLMVAVPILCATAVWVLLGWLFWARLTDWVNALLMASVPARWLTGWATGVLQFVGTLVALALLAPCILITALLITEFFTLPALISFVADRYYPQLVRVHGGTVAGSVANTTAAIVIFALLWLVTLPLWFTGIGALTIPVINSAYLNQRVFRYDALAEHASTDELRGVIANNKRSLYLLGLLLAVFYYVPLLNLLVPALSGLAFTHFQLDALSRLRAGATLPTVR